MARFFPLLFAVVFGVALPSIALAQALPTSGADGAGDGTASLSLSVVAFAQRSPVPITGLYFMVEVPFERLLAPSGPGSPGAVSPHVLPMLPVARDAVLHAWSAAGLAGDERLDAMARRARWSALLPDVRFRVLRSDKRSDVTSDDGVRSDATYGATEWYEARVGLRLDRLVFADEEVAIERLRIEREHERETLAAKVVAELGKLSRAQLDEADPAEDDHAHLEAMVRELEASMMLDVLTGGWFSKWLARPR